jgi:hypothetical protein
MVKFGILTISYGIPINSLNSTYGSEYPKSLLWVGKEESSGILLD